MPRTEYISLRDYMIFIAITKGASVEEATKLIDELTPAVGEKTMAEKKTFDFWDLAYTTGKELDKVDTTPEAE